MVSLLQGTGFNTVTGVGGVGTEDAQLCFTEPSERAFVHRKTFHWDIYEKQTKSSHDIEKFIIVSFCLTFIVTAKMIFLKYTFESQKCVYFSSIKKMGKPGKLLSVCVWGVFNF